MTNSGEAVDLDVNQLLSSTENIGLRVLTSLKAQPKSWMLIAGEYARAGRIDTADELLSFAINGEHIPDLSHPCNAIQITHPRLRAPGLARELCGPVDAQSIRHDRRARHARLPRPRSSSRGPQDCLGRSQSVPNTHSPPRLEVGLIHAGSCRMDRVRPAGLSRQGCRELLPDRGRLFQTGGRSSGTTAEASTGRGWKG